MACVRHNGVSAEMLAKTMEESPNMSLDLALKHVIFAKNCQESHLGFTPYQLVYGINPKLPSVLKDDISALECSSVSQQIADHFKLLQTRANFGTADCSDKLKRALLEKVRYSDGSFSPGEYVYYKRDQSGPWHGPARVIFPDGQELIVKEGGQVITVHSYQGWKQNQKYHCRFLKKKVQHR